MPIQDPNNPHPTRSSEWVQANQRYEQELLRRTGPHPACFPAGTPILTPTGRRPIEAIRAGEPVLATGRDGVLRARPVHRTARPALAAITRVHWGRGEAPLATTAHHAFLSERGWVRCMRLGPGDRLRRIDAEGRGTWVRVAGVEPAQAVELVFNLIVERELTFVADGFVVHGFGHLRLVRTLWHRLGLAARAGAGLRTARGGDPPGARALTPVPATLLPALLARAPGGADFHNRIRS